MKSMRKILATAAIALLGTFASAVLADDKAIAQKFYDLLSNPGSASHVAAFNEVTADDWESIGNYSGKNKNRDQFLGQIGGFAKLIPDLNWEPQEIIAMNGQVVVRSRATGTPAGPFFGVDGKGNSFDIMTIDIHTIVDGKIVRSHHVEDWAGALGQLKGQ